MTLNGNISSDCIQVMQGDDRILNLLRELSEMHSPVYFELGADASKSYITRLHGIHDSSALLVEPLMPPEGNELLGETPGVKACCTLNGVRYEFDTALVGISSNDPSLLMLARPSKLTRIQMRQYARINFPEESALPVKVVRSAHVPESASGTAVQLGAGGMGLIVASPEGWEAGTEIEKIMFVLPDGHTIYTAATVRSLFPLRHADGTVRGYRCNLQFVQLEHRYSTALAAFIFKTQLAANSGDTSAAA